MEVIKGHYHHGLTIKEAREKQHMTQAQLAELWPKSERFGGGTGVSLTYVRDIERGAKHIEDQYTLRRLAEILCIPLWKFGLADYDPFRLEVLPGGGKTMYSETLDLVEDLVRQIWSLRCAARMIDAEKGVTKLNNLFAYFQEHLPPPLRLERRFRLLAIQAHRLNAATALEQKRYDDAIDIYTQTCRAALSLGDASVIAQSLKGLGKELERKGEKQEGLALLEQARDAALGSSKLLLAFVYSYLIRLYASNGDLLRFERAVSTGLTLAKSLEGHYEDGTDFVYSWSPVSSVLAEQSWGYLALRKPAQTLKMRETIAREVYLGQDVRVEAWLPLDWARAYHMLGEIEMCVEEARNFYHRTTAMQSPHAISQIDKLVVALEKDGYGELPVVRNFKQELDEQSRSLS